MQTNRTKTLPREFQIRTNRISSSAGAILFSALLLALLMHPGRLAAAQATEQTANEPLVTLENHVPFKVHDGTAVRVSHYNTEKKLRLAIFVTPPDLAGEEQLIREQQTKGSPNFHKFLSADEWNERFGPKV